MLCVISPLHGPEGDMYCFNNTYRILVIYVTGRIADIQVSQEEWPRFTQEQGVTEGNYKLI